MEPPDNSGGGEVLDSAGGGDLARPPEHVKDVSR
jgi:hypothetical protein